MIRLWSWAKIDAEIAVAQRESGHYTNTDMAAVEKRAVFVRSYVAWRRGEAAFRKLVETDDGARRCFFSCVYPDWRHDQKDIDEFVAGAMEQRDLWIAKEKRQLGRLQ